ncbi:unnamed protein product, partial [Mesorhabditis belari]|uniref:Mid2 domain-containing protein n=1 Tax=Mesorhabditis belari TaxID=2138241 RepID=A0AAF3E9I3_9BILA
MRCLLLAVIAIVLGLSKAQETVIFDLTLSIDDDECAVDLSQKSTPSVILSQGTSTDKTLKTEDFDVEVDAKKIKFIAQKEIRFDATPVNFEASWKIDNTTKECEATSILIFQSDSSFNVSFSTNIAPMGSTTPTTTTTPTTATTTNALSTSIIITTPGTTTPTTTATTTPTTTISSTPATLKNPLAVRYAFFPKAPDAKKDEKKCDSHAGAVAFAVIEALIIVGLVAFLVFKFCIQPRRNFGGSYPSSAYYDNTTGRGDNIDSYRRPRTQDIGMESYSYAINNGNSNPVSRPVNTPATTTTSPENRVALPVMTMSSNNPPPLSSTTPALVPIDISSPNNRPNQNQNQNQNHLDLSLAWNDPFQ